MVDICECCCCRPSSIAPLPSLLLSFSSCVRSTMRATWHLLPVTVRCEICLPHSRSLFLLLPFPVRFRFPPPPTHPVRVCTCAWLMLILDDIIASSAQRFWEKVFPPDWSIDMTSIAKPLIDAAPTVSLSSCLINMHIMSTTLTKWSTICDHLKLTIVSGHWSCHLSWHNSHFLTVNFGNYFK